MSFTSIVYGRIISGEPIYENKKIINSGATYKQVEDDLTSWLIKFEDILSRLNFLTAKKFK